MVKAWYADEPEYGYTVFYVNHVPIWFKRKEFDPTPPVEYVTEEDIAA